MKSYGYLFDKVCDVENVLLAIERSSRGKRSRKEVKYVYSNKYYFASKISDIIKNDEFVGRKHKVKIINDGINRKRRQIVQPDYIYEQIVHHAIVQVLSPIIVKSSYEYSCGSMPNRGGLYGKKYIEKFIKNHPNDCQYCLKLDIHHYFQSVNQDLLKKLFKRKLKDYRLILLLYKVIDSYEDSPGYGIPIGYYTSQWFANWYLEGLDHYIKEILRAKCYVRYMDDIIIFSSSKEELHNMKILIERYLKEGLDLQINKKWQVFKFDDRPLDFMGYKFYRNRTVLRKSIMYKSTRKAKKIYKNKESWYSACQMISYLGWYKHTNTYNVYLKYIKPYISVYKLKKRMSISQRRINKCLNGK